MYHQRTNKCESVSISGNVNFYCSVISVPYGTRHEVVKCRIKIGRRTKAEHSRARRLIINSFRSNMLIVSEFTVLIPFYFVVSLSYQKENV